MESILNASSLTHAANVALRIASNELVGGLRVVSHICLSALEYPLC